ncbi:histidine kinase dimerization/phosphoacceptor domain -containing protein [Mucilaginibacter sp. cycad4]|uniref:histidine kinase dimerization/phosphoacceptor domain -containing protein n=1 Tax=Mucilaginibacter sp. cycad4 TaxID=3342096 RepID=UPI002AAAC9FA|nr:histidine kinase dimerization/phosphoacceptor domain -containing protein [Mucilaginibacter gossypii]WPU99132.1 histidine kinase dimerization/phosphoacceptor domain -containing protein [Mucilaginibacter gossypii]
MFIKLPKILLIGVALLLISWQYPREKWPADAANFRLQLDKADSDTARITKMIQLGLYYIYTPVAVKRKPDSAMVLAKEALQLSLKTNDHNKLGFSKDFLSRIYKFRGDMEQAIELEKAAIAEFKINSNWDAVGYGYKQLAGYYTYTNDKDLSQRISYTETALLYYQRSNNRFKLGETYQELGNLYGLHSQQFIAIRYLKEGIAMYNSIGYKAQQGLYNMLNESYCQAGDYKQAIGYGLKAIQLSEENNDTPEERAAIFNHVGITYMRLTQLDKAAYYFRQGLSIAKANHDQESYDVIAINFSGVLNGLKKPYEAISILKTVDAGSDHEKATIMYSNFLRAYMLLKDFNIAAGYLTRIKQSISKMDKMSAMREIAYMNMVSFYFAKNDFEAARRVLVDLGNVSRFNLSTATKASNEHWLFKIDSAEGRYISAIRHSQLEKRIQDTLLNDQKNRSIAELEVAYETEKKARELTLKNQSIQILTKRTQVQGADLQQAALLRNVTISGIILLGLLLAVSFSRYRIKQRNNLKLVAQQRIIASKNTSLEKLVTEKDTLLIEREWLLKEIHHRVKNNLQIVISLLNSQTIYIENGEALEALRESQHRMQSISLIHQKLYQSDNLARIDMYEYISELVQYLSESFNLKNQIEIIQEIEPISLDVVQAVPIGLILNEAITNAIKYAFPSGTRGSIFIGLDEPIPGDLSLIICDNGKGLPADFDIERCSTLGMSMIKGLAGQLHGELSILSGDGVKLELTILGYLTKVGPTESTKLMADGVALS